MTPKIRSKPRPAAKAGPTAPSPFLRLWESQPMTAEVAWYVVSLRFAEGDRLRLRDLLERNREGMLAPEEVRELDEFESVSLSMSLLQSKARLFLKKQEAAASRG